MAENFELAIDHNGKEYILQGELRTFGYTHKIFIVVNDVEVMFEPDEERNFRAVIQGNPDKVDKVLIGKIIEELERSLK